MWYQKFVPLQKKTYLCTFVLFSNFFMPFDPLTYDKQDLQNALQVLRNGGLILYPTDTIWGLGCDATNPQAVERIFRIKQREDAKSMLVLLDAPGKIQGYVSQIPDMAWELLEVSEGQKPLTIIYPQAKNLAPNIVAEDGSVGIRITGEIFSKALCQQLKRPIVSTSANISGQPSPTCFEQISQAIKEQVDYICLFRQEEQEAKQSSSIIKIDINNVIQIIRP